MAITVTGYGEITQTNAREIYLAYSRGQLELDKSQQTKCESFLSPEELDEIAYDEEVREHKSSSKINTKNEDGEVVEDNGNWQEGASTGASLVAGTGGTIAGIINVICQCKRCSSVSILNEIAAALAVAGSVVALAMSFPSSFDNQLPDRLAKKDEAPNTNQVMQGYSEGLGASMEMMAEDTKLYEEQSAQLTLTKNEQTSRGAELQMEYDTAMAMGDTAGAEKAKAEMQQLEKTDNSQMEEELAATGEAIGEYKAMNAESVAVKEAGATVSGFLKAGHTKATLAYTNATLCGIGALAATYSALQSSLAPITGISASVIFAVCAATMGLATYNFIDRGGEERECGNSGDEMQTHIDGLNDMIGQQETYTEDTEAAFAASDEASTESQAKAGEQADKSVSQNNENLEQEEPTITITNSGNNPFAPV